VGEKFPLAATRFQVVRVENPPRYRESKQGHGAQLLRHPQPGRFSPWHYGTALELAETFKRGGGCGSISRPFAQGLPAHNAARVSTGQSHSWNFTPSPRGSSGSKDAAGRS
jgi:hypothetical protein